MKFSEEVISIFSPEFIRDITPYMEKLVSVYGTVYYAEERDFGHGVVPGSLLVRTGHIDRATENNMVSILRKYSSNDDTEGGGIYFLQLPGERDGYKEFCVNE